MMKRLLFPTLLLVCSLFISCSDDFDDTKEGEAFNADTAEINDYIYRALNFFYLYKADTPELANNAFANASEKDTFLNSFETPEALFEFLKSPVDRFSRLFEDYTVIENALGGVTLNNGMKFGFVFYPDDSGNVFGYIRYVVPNSSAANQGLMRGIIFNRIDGTQLTENNFSDLVAPNTYTIGLATFDGTTITPIDTEITLVKEQITENPVHVTTTINHEGVKVGYVMYNAFTSNFDEELNNAFGQLAAEGVTELVLDLRYNGGGSVRTATDLAGMITGQFTGEIFYTEEWNDDRQAEYADNGNFTNSLPSGTALNSLNLSRVFVLTTTRTASASELVINGLEPYIDVVQVGRPTTGKFQASTLLYDAPAPTFSRSQANPGHTYVMLPLIFKTANAAGNTDYVDGLLPDVDIREDFANLGILGNPDEPLLAEALNIIVPTRQANQNFTQLEEAGGSELENPISEKMILDIPQH